MAYWATTTLGLVRGDSIALNMMNRGEYMMVWLGIAKCGARTYLINPMVKGESLLHAIKVAGTKHVVFGYERRDECSVLKSIHGLKLWCFAYEAAQRPPPWSVSFTAALEQVPETALPAHLTARGRGVDSGEPFMYIFTSGTTGLPKAALVTTDKILRVGIVYSRMMNLHLHDRLYTALPLCHSSACLIGCGSVLRSGCTLVVSPKFSASRFWSEVYHTRATIIQYIGEIGRYLLVHPRTAATEEHETKHCVRAAVGNGLAADIWESFRSRFGIANVLDTPRSGPCTAC